MVNNLFDLELRMAPGYCIISMLKTTETSVLNIIL